MIKAASKSDPLEMAVAKEELSALTEPQIAHCKRYGTNDATIEKLQELLSQNERGLLLFRDELVGLCRRCPDQPVPEISARRPNPCHPTPHGELQINRTGDKHRT